MADETTTKGLNLKPLFAFLGNSMTSLSQLKQGFDTVTTAKYNQSLYEQEAKIEEAKSAYNSYIIRMRRDIEEQQHVDAGRKLMGEQTVMYGGSGAALSSGSVLEALSNTAKEIEKDRLLIGFNADLEDKSQRYSSAAKAAGLRNKGAEGVYSARLVRSNSIMQAGSTLLAANTQYQASTHSKKTDYDKSIPTISPRKTKKYVPSLARSEAPRPDTATPVTLK